MEAKLRNVVNMDPVFWDAIHSGMRGVVQNMSFFSDFPYEVAGKTGTAEFDTAKNRAISWFIGYREGVDSVDEERLVLVMLDVPYMDPYTSLKFNIARELLKADVIIDPNAQPTDEPNQ